MVHLNVFIEINGKQTEVGKIFGSDYSDACFAYNGEYMDSDIGEPISISLPFQSDAFSPEQTKSYFESLLPEGFSRRAVAGWVRADERDYITILKELGRECLGAVRISEVRDSGKNKDEENKLLEPGDKGGNEKSAGQKKNYKGKVLGSQEVDVEESVGHKKYEKLSLNEVKALAAEGATKSTRILMETHLSLTGASGKVGLFYDAENDTWYLPKGEAPSSHIVKQSHVRLEKIILNEQLCMMTARTCDIPVCDSFIINLGKGKDDEVLYATQRYDRLMGQGEMVDGMKSPIRLHQEDFAQALGIKPAEKYEKEKSGYLSRMFGLVQDYCTNPIEDKKQLLEMVIFSYLIGNTDCHVKNFSLLYSSDLKSVRLAPAYDIVATQVYHSTPEMSFYIGNEIIISQINRSDFVDVANEIGLGRTMVEKTFDSVAMKFEGALKKATDELKQMGYKDAVKIKKSILETGGYRNIL
ncbi:MAG: HipA domain-containing protein [Lachnospiraceae bacterium]|nr:HipA domain-containing protein [Lachnospiraceae bacterium]